MYVELYAKYMGTSTYSFTVSFNAATCLALCATLLIIVVVTSDNTYSANYVSLKKFQLVLDGTAEL